MSAQQGHSPLPWESGGRHILDADGIVILTGDSGDGYELDKANAQLAARAINSHAVLVVALESCINLIEDDLAHLTPIIPPDESTDRDFLVASLIEQTRAALAASKAP